MNGQVHHIELYVSDLERSRLFWAWLLERLGYTLYQTWPLGFSYSFDKTYIVFVQTETNYLKEAYLPALKRIGIKAVGVFKPKTFSADSITKLIVVIPFKNAKQFLQLDQKLAKDPIYLDAGADYAGIDHIAI